MEDLQPASDYERELLSSAVLPTVPPVAQRLLQLIGEGAELAEIAEVIATDTSLSAKLLRVINSPMYGMSRPINSVREALLYLGVNSVRSMALSFSFVEGLRGGRAADQQIMWRAALTTALAARRIAAERGDWEPEDAFLMGLLSDAGALLMYNHDPTYRELYARFVTGSTDLIELEREARGTDHARVGALLFASWNFPREMCELVGIHHDAGPDDDPASLDPRIATLNAAWVCARTLTCSGFCAEVPELRGWLSEFLGLGATVIEGILDEVPEELRTVAASFELQIGKQASYQELLIEANDRLRELALESERSFRELSAGGDARSFTDLREAVAVRPQPETGLLSAADLETLLQAYLPHARRQRCVLSLVILEIGEPDDGKPDDAPLLRLADSARDFMRGDDVIGRIGDDQIGLLLVDCDPANALRVAERIRKLAAGEDASSQAPLTTGAACALPCAEDVTAASLIAEARGPLAS